MKKMTEEEFAAYIAEQQDAGIHYREPYEKGSWKDRRIAAINRLSNHKGWPCSDNNRYFEQYNAILNSDATSLLEFKKQWKEKNGHN
jgi:hypothetical protein